MLNFDYGFLLADMYCRQLQLTEKIEIQMGFSHIDILQNTIPNDIY